MTASIAILGDLHGHYTLAFTLLKRWEKETGKTLDAVLQVGDMGIFPHPAVCIDEATKRFAEQDPDEISFQQFYEGTGDAELLFGGERPLFDKNMLFIAGNHEDFDFLAQHEGPEGVCAVDAFGKFHYLRDGAETAIETKRNGPIIIAGLGRLEHEVGQREPWHFSNVAYKKLMTKEGIDILLTHHPPFDGTTERGSPKVKELIEIVQPTYHFCGHYHDPGQQLSVQGKTQSYLLNEVNFRNARRINPGSIGILTWEHMSQHSFSFIDEPWLQEYTRDNYRSKLRELI